MPVELGLNTGFALNRFTTPEEWIPLVGEVLKIKLVQFTADLLTPSLPDKIVKKQLQRINALSSKHGLKIKHTFTSAFTRVNHLAHPDAELRDYWLNWFKRFVDISAALGAESMGGHLGIFTVKDYHDPEIRRERFGQVIEAWKKIADYAAKKKLLKYLTWEPMSIGREMGETIEEAKRIHRILNMDIALPMKLCLDVDHGNVASQDPADTDPYRWITEFGSEIAILHLKQSHSNKGGHWPFVPEHNENGKISPSKIVRCLKMAGVNDVALILELTFREREPFESRVVDDLKTSVEYWRPFISPPKNCQ